MTVYVLDTSLLLGGRDPPRDGSWATTPEAAAEISPGGRDARRFADWQSVGLTIAEPGQASQRAVTRVAREAGNLDRLSGADRSLLGLALELGATLVSDDYTMLDVARRLGLQTQTVNTQGIQATKDWQPRCTGCGRWFAEAPKGRECPVCGSPVKDRVRR